jgi:hypothetical protein
VFIFTIHWKLCKLCSSNIVVKQSKNQPKSFLHNRHEYRFRS